MKIKVNDWGEKKKKNRNEKRKKDDLFTMDQAKLRLEKLKGFHEKSVQET